MKSSRYYLKSPTKGNEAAKFSIIERLPEGRTRLFKSSRLEVINRLFKAGTLHFEEARLQAKEVLASLRPKVQKPQFLESNMKCLKVFWDAEYAHRDLVSRPAAWNWYLRAISALGNISLTATSQQALQKHLDSRFKGNKHRSIVAALNPILKMLKTGIKLRPAREEFVNVRYVNNKELDLILKEIHDDKMKLLCRVAYSSGLRIGEIFTISQLHWTEDKRCFLKVTSQLDERGVIRRPKNRKERTALILSGFEDSVRAWAELSKEDRWPLRQLPHSKILRKASRKALKREIVFHDLRHSYAIHLASRGVPMHIISQFLGDGLAVVEQYYVGFVATPESVRLASKLV